jgi:two-component system response regulator AtoC
VAVNCAAIPPGLVESELFGHVRGSFTDAVRDKRGLFEAANGGTLFLDEIADLPLLLQVKLLRVLQDGVIRRVGDVDDLRVEARVVAATARDLLAEVHAGRFREDLYYRLAGLSIHIPPLRDRPDDIPLLAYHFLERARQRLRILVNDIQPEALQILCEHTWPGNVRELENTIERAAVLCTGGSIDAPSLPDRLLAGRTTPDPGLPQMVMVGGDDPADLSIKRASRRAEEDLIRRALAETGGNRTKAAELLEISHRALLYKIKEYGIVVPRD